jgi:hypothetical protein
VCTKDNHVTTAFFVLDCIKTALSSLPLQLQSAMSSSLQSDMMSSSLQLLHSATSSLRLLHMHDVIGAIVAPALRNHCKAI